MSPNFVSGRTGAFEWLFQRISGVFLAVCFTVHFVVLHFMSGGVITYDTVTTRLASPYWKAFDLCFLLFALYHAVTGLRLIVDDYIHAPAWRTLATSILWVLAIVLFVLGAVIIFSIKAPGA